jgi:mannose-6-phosphate isomerase-like protein (cupin superfamily)
MNTSFPEKAIAPRIAYKGNHLPILWTDILVALFLGEGAADPKTCHRNRYNRTINRTEGHMKYQAINFGRKFGLFDEQWQPKVIAEMNDYQFKIARLEGDFIWHDHKDTDETFIVIEGMLRIDFRDGAVELSAGEMFVVPKGVEHKPYAEGEVKLLLIEPRGVLNTGHEGGDRTAQNDVWI